MNSTLPPYVTREFVQDRLPLIFPEGFEFRTNCTSPAACATVFTMLYVGAVDGCERYIKPKHVYRMSDVQAARTSDASRLDYASQVVKKGFISNGTTWYADNTREPIRDEALRSGLLSAGAAVVKKDVPTTADVPRYALDAGFAALFDPTVVDDALLEAIERWRQTHLTRAALARIEVMRAGAAKDTVGVEVAFPNGEGRRLAPGPSSTIAKAVVEEFAPRFLVAPAVLWLSESRNKVVARDEILSRRIGLNINAARNLPDIILADVGQRELLLVFVEVVATDGPMTKNRRAELLFLAQEARLEERQVVFMTAFMDRGAPALRKVFAELAWNSFIWVASEPEHIVALVGAPSAGPTKLHVLLELASGGS